MPALDLSSLPANRAREKIARRILPFVFLLYIISYLDRANVAFAKMSLISSLGFSEAVFGFGAGIFFLGYILFEIPGALIVERWSARKWIARILISWGVCATLLGFVRTPMQFYGARFVLGCAEGGFFPGIIVYLTHWFTARDRARAFSIFIVGIPASLALGAPISSLALRLRWLGVPGWRWMFILEGLPAVITGIITLIYLTDLPGQATWLEEDERVWIVAELQRENQRFHKSGDVGFWRSILQRNTLLLAMALCFANVGGYAFVFLLPTIIRMSSSFSIATATAWSSWPFLAGIIATVLSGRISQQAHEHKLYAAVPLILTGAFFTLSAIPGQDFYWVLLFLCMTAAMFYAFAPPFWVLPTLFLRESVGAASIGLINCIANFGGFLGPSTVGLILSKTHSYFLAIVFLSVSFVLGGITLLTLRMGPRVSNADAS